MKRLPLFLTVIMIFGGFISFPFSALAIEEPDTSSCDPGTIACSCPLSISSADSGVQSADTADACYGVCSSYAASGSYTDMSGWLLQCEQGGDLITLAQGGVASTSTTDTGGYFDAPSLGIDIPGLTLSQGYSNGTTFSTNYLAEYINAVYTWLLSAAALVAVIMLMIAGMQYVLARGEPKKIGLAVKRIEHALVGLVLLVAAYTIAYTINPAMTAFEGLSVTTVAKVDYTVPQYDSTSSTPINLTSVAANSITQGILPGDITCSGTSVADVAKSANGKITYRYGATGGDPPYNLETHHDASGVAYSTYCPEGTICFDCAGFANYITQCVGLTKTPYDYNVSSGGAVDVTSWDASGIINGQAMNPGDFLAVPRYHVVTYIGDGQVVDCHSDRDPGSCVGFYSVDYVFTSMFSGKTVQILRNQ